MNSMHVTPLASALVRKVFSVYLAFAIALTLFQIGMEYRNAYSNVVDEVESTIHAFQPGIADALWNYQGPLLDSIAKGMVNSSAVIGVEIKDISERIKVAM